MRTPPLGSPPLAAWLSMAASAAALAATLAVLAPARAIGQPQGDRQAAQAAFVAATEAEARGDFATAAREYQRTYDLTKDPTLLERIGRAHEEAGRPTEALTAYRRFLAEAQPTGDARARVEIAITGLERDLLERQAEGQDPGSSSASAEPVPPDDPPAGDPAGGAPGAGGVTSVPTFLEEGPTWQRNAAWISVGVGAVFLTTAAVLGTSASSRQDDLERLVNFRDPATDLPATYSGVVRRQYEDALDEGDRLETWALVAFAGAGVATAAAVTFFILDPGPAAAEEPVAAGGLRLAPVVGRAGTGLSLGWTF